METEALDDALTVFAATAPTYGSLGLANHGPMAAEALAHLGRHDAIPGWVAQYRTRLDDAPPPARPLTEAEWPAALGRDGPLPRVARPLRARDRRSSRGRGRGRVGAAAAPGLRRCGDARAHPHRSRAARARAMPTRRRGASRWPTAWPSGPASYEELPGPPLLIGHEGVADALADLPYLPEDAPRPCLISDRVAAVADIADEFEQAVASLGWTGGAVDLLDQLATGGCAGLPAQRRRRRGHRPPARGDLAAGLRAGAALAGGGGPGRRPGLRLAGRGGLARRLRHRPGRARTHGRAAVHRRPGGAALASGDEHAIKLTEAALRSFGRTGDAVLLLAAADACERL